MTAKTTERMVNRDDAKQIIDSLNRICNEYPAYVMKPTLKQESIEYDGNEKELANYLYDYDKTRVLITGTQKAIKIGNYISQLQLKNSTDKWIDGTTSVLTILWRISIDGTTDFSFANLTDDSIDKFLDAADQGIIDLETDCGWTVGDERIVHLSAIEAGDYNVAHAEQDVTLVLMDTDHYDLAEETEYGQTKSKFVIGLKETLLEDETMNEQSTNRQGWDGCRGRKCCQALIKMFPEYLQRHMKPFVVKTASTGGNTSRTLIDSIDTLSLFAEKEALINRSASQDVENDLTVIKYYQSVSTHKKYLFGTTTANQWYTRSPYYNSFTAFIRVGTNGNWAANMSSNYAEGFAPFFCI